MLTKKNRLSGKNINRLLRRGRTLYGKQFVCLVFPQRHTVGYTQRSINIPVKLDKRATMRNFLKRQAKISFVRLYATYTMPTHRQLFVFVNKKTLDELKQLVATAPKSSILPYRQEVCRQDFTYFLRQLCLPLSPSGGKKQLDESKHDGQKKTV